MASAESPNDYIDVSGDVNSNPKGDYAAGNGGGGGGGGGGGDGRGGGSDASG